MSFDEVYVALRRKDEHIAALIDTLEDLRSLIAERSSDEAKQASWDKAHEETAEILYRHGLRSDGRLR